MKRDSWFDRTFGAFACNDPEGDWIADQEREAENPKYGPGNPDWERDFALARDDEADRSGVVCSGKCRKGAIDPDCPLHGVWRLP